MLTHGFIIIIIVIMTGRGVCRGAEQAGEASSSMLAAMAGLQESARRSQQHSFSSQADSLILHHQARLAQVQDPTCSSTRMLLLFVLLLLLFVPLLLLFVLLLLLVLLYVMLLVLLLMMEQLAPQTRFPTSVVHGVVLQVCCVALRQQCFDMEHTGCCLLRQRAAALSDFPLVEWGVAFGTTPFSGLVYSNKLVSTSKHSKDLLDKQPTDHLHLHMTSSYDVSSAASNSRHSLSLCHFSVQN